MSLHFSNQDLSILIAIPITLIVQLWTLVIFKKNKRHWKAYDIAIVAILIESMIRNLSILSYVISLQRFPWEWPKNAATTTMMKNWDKCTVFVWIFNSSHTFHASCLLTISAIGAVRVRMRGNERHLRHYLTPTHVIYHLFCLTTLCACVGVAAILAVPETYSAFATFGSADRTVSKRVCDLLPYQLDVKYNAFIVVLHSFLATVAMASTVYATVMHCARRRNVGQRQTGLENKSPSQLSLSTTLTLNNNDNYDTYTVRRHHPHHHHDGGLLLWKTDYASNVSTTVSSTNSRRPLNGPNVTRKDDEETVTGLETINTILLVSYIFYHFPVIALCMFPNSFQIEHLTTPSIILWLGLIQDILTPIALGLIDSRFNRWVSNVYRCMSHSHEEIEGKLPHAGLDGKFRHFGSQPQSLDYQMQALNYHHQPHKFPITNGSLYTSIDGRVPIIHNYRRHNNNNNNNTNNQAVTGLNLNYPSSNLIRTNAITKKTVPCDNCRVHAVTNAITPHHGQHQDHFRNAYVLRHASLSQESLKQMPLGNEEASKIRAKSYHQHHQHHHEPMTTDPVIDDEDVFAHFEFEAANNRYYSSDDTSSQSSSFSITTEANGDFEFFQRTNCTSSSSNQAIKHRDVEMMSPPVKMMMDNNNKSLSVEVLHDLCGGPPQLNVNNNVKMGGSVPDLKKIFISEYL